MHTVRTAPRSPRRLVALLTALCVIAVTAEAAVPVPLRKPTVAVSVSVSASASAATSKSTSTSTSASVPLPARKPGAAHQKPATSARPDILSLLHFGQPLIAPLPRPVEATMAAVPAHKPDAPKKSPKEQARVTLAALNKAMDKGDWDRAAQTLSDQTAVKILKPADREKMKTRLAAGYLYDGQLDKALRWAAMVNKGAEWTGGLAAWRKKDYTRAVSYFEKAALSAESDWGRAGAAFWASRAHMRLGNMREVSTWLDKAADHPRTFYGLIALRALGRDFEFNWDVPDYTAAHRRLIAALPEGQQALELAAEGRRGEAQKALRGINPRGDRALAEALLAFAIDARLPGLAMKLAENMSAPQGGAYDAALYPLSPWEPRDGFTVDRALINAIIRQESRFNPLAESGSGATGLMQLMPATASHVRGRAAFREAGGKDSLRDPEINLAIGQRYVEALLDSDHVSTELFSLVTAYNAGPGNLRKWKEKLKDTTDDPLLFIESLPASETRAFVERVMANYWIYRQRLKQPVPSLDAVAEGRWARYAALDAPRRGRGPI